MFRHLMICLLFPMLVHDDPVIHLELSCSSAAAGDQIIAKILVNEIENLDSYSFDVFFDVSEVELIGADIQAPLSGILNVLSPRHLIPLIRKEKDHVNIAATVPGDEPTGRITRDGLIGVVFFRALKSGEVKSVYLRNVSLLDIKRIPIEVKTSADSAHIQDR